MADEDRPGGVTLSARDYMRAIRPSGDNPSARPFNLVPPPRDKQFRTAQLRADRSKRRAERRLEAKLDAGGEEGRAMRAVNLVELTRLWWSFGYRELRDGLLPEAEERLHRQLAAVLAGEEDSDVVWHATVSAIREARRVAEVQVGLEPRRWRQVFSRFDYW
jgi:hypothetical protein